MKHPFLILAVFTFALPMAAADDDVAFFESKVRPLLVEHCYECHSGTKAKGGLLLEDRDGWSRGGDSGPAIVPGSPDESLLIKAISYGDEAAQMPPAGKLPDDAIAVLTDWVRRGAPDPRVAAAKIGGMSAEDARSWWAFQPLADTQPPDATADSQLVQNDIDRFILHRLVTPVDPDIPAQAGIQSVTPAPPADRRTLIRRATYDLTGLPPTPDEVSAFVNDPTPDAFAAVVDRLLASPHYGEHQDRRWLDVARYADTAGENTDRPLPDIWRYRNWVFDAFNRDLPFDEFTRLQLAGDIVRAGSSGADYTEGIVATGYLAVARRFGHDIDKDVHLMHEDVIDNIGKTFLGLTISCARCHDHKYDPITADDYYALSGILASTRFSFSGCEAKGPPRDLVPAITAAEADAILKHWRERRAQTLPRIDAIAAEIPTARSTFLAGISTSLRLLASADLNDGGSATLHDGQHLPLDRITVRKGELIHLAILSQDNHGADTTQIELEITELSDAGRRWSTNDLIPQLSLGNPHPGSSSAAATWCFMDWRDGPAFLSEHIESIEGRPELKAWRNGDTPAIIVNTSPDPVTVWTTLPARSVFLHPGPSGPVGLEWVSPIDGEISITGRVSDVHPGGANGVTFRLEHMAAPESGVALTTLAALLHEQADLIRKRDEEAGPEPTIPMAFAVMEAEAKNIRLHERGDPEKPGPEVPRHWLGILGGDQLPADAGSGRRELAEWISGHPLSTRVIVNRVWQGHFGQGLVRTVNDFGSRGDRPTHPELLDWLCRQFESQGRRLKPLHRMIMLGAAYQRASVVDQSVIEHDPDNRLLARFERRRLSAEELRDSLLAVSGRLDRSPGEAHPFPPAASWTFTQHTPFNAVYDDTRRTVYQMVQRQRRHPFLALFDGADPNASTGLRQTTTVPTQALFFLNDPFFHENAAAFATLTSSQSDRRTRIRVAYSLLFQREPEILELEQAEQFLNTYPGDAQEQWSAWSRLLTASNEFLYVD